MAARRIMPAYGRDLLAKREQGLKPTWPVVVSMGIWELVRYWTPAPCLVVADDVAVEQIDVRVLHGLDVVCAFRTKNEPRAREFVNRCTGLSVKDFSLVDIQSKKSWSVDLGRVFSKEAEAVLLERGAVTQQQILELRQPVYREQAAIVTRHFFFGERPELPSFLGFSA